MAQTSPVRERGQTTTTAKATSQPAAASPSANAGKPASGTNGPRKGFLASLLSPAPQAAGPDGQRKPLFSGMFRFTLVLVVFMFAIQGVQIGLVLAEQKWHLGLLNFVSNNRNTPILGGLRWLDLIFFLVVIGFYVALIRFNILPRDIFGARARTAGPAAQRTGTPVERPAGSGRDRSRAARRHAAATVTAATAARAAKNTRGAKKPATEPAPVKTATASATPQASGEHDAEYYRVKAAQRLQRRRSGKR